MADLTWFVEKTEPASVQTKQGQFVRGMRVYIRLWDGNVLEREYTNAEFSPATVEADVRDAYAKWEAVRFLKGEPVPYGETG